MPMRGSAALRRTEWTSELGCAGLGLEQYEQAFRDNDVDADLLARLTAEDLNEIGVASVGHRRRLFDAIAAMQAEIAPYRHRPRTP